MKRRLTDISASGSDVITATKDATLNFLLIFLDFFDDVVHCLKVVSEVSTAEERLVAQLTRKFVKTFFPVK